MTLLLDNILNTYLGLLSCFIILEINTLNIKRFFILLIVDIILNKIPIVTFIILIIFYINKFIYKYLNKNNLNLFFISIINYFIFINILYFINSYTYNFIYYLTSNLYSIVFNIIVFYIYIFLYNKEH